MSAPKHRPRSGGFVLAVSILAGAVGGILAGEPSLGFLAGLGVGLLLLLLIWLKDRSA